MTRADRMATYAFLMARSFQWLAQGHAREGVEYAAQAAEYLHSDIYKRIHCVWGIDSYSREMTFDMLELA